MLQVLICEGAVDGDVVLEQNGGTARLMMNSLTALEYEVTATLNADSETRELNVDDHHHHQQHHHRHHH